MGEKIEVTDCKSAQAGVIFKGARGNQDYDNIIIFNQTILNSIFSGKTPIKLK